MNLIYKQIIIYWQGMRKTQSISWKRLETTVSHLLGFFRKDLVRKTPRVGLLWLHVVLSVVLPRDVVFDLSRDLTDRLRVMRGSWLWKTVSCSHVLLEFGHMSHLETVSVRSPLCQILWPSADSHSSQYLLLPSSSLWPGDSSHFLFWNKKAEQDF